MLRERHVIIVGLDGMPWDALNVLVNSGVMPNLRGLLNKAVKARLRPLVPVTGPSWTDMVTTVNPGKHGIFDFLKLDERTFTWRKNTPLDVMHPRLHEILAMQNSKSIMINVPITTPPLIESKHFVILSSWLRREPKIYPREKAEKLLKGIEFSRVYGRVFGAASIENYLEGIADLVELKIEVAERALEHEAWNLVFIVFSEPDWIFHRIYGEVLRRTKTGRMADHVMRRIDDFFKVVLKSMPEDALLMVVSDHGFAEYRRAINVNVLLKKIGYLKMAPQSLKRLTLNRVLHLLPSEIKAKLRKYVLLLMSGKKHKMKISSMATSPIDYRGSVAYMQVFGNVYVNPLLPKTVRRKAALRILEALNKYRGELGLITLKDNLYRGPYIEKAPEVIALPGRATITPKMLSNNVVDRGLWYSHSPYGIFIAYGEHVVPSRLNVVWSFDVGATALYYLGCPLPHTCDGRPLKKIFDQEAAESKVQYRNYLTKYQLLLKAKKVKYSV